MNTASVRDKLVNGMCGTLGKVIDQLHYPNFFWELSWDVTCVCNACCIYCPEPRADEHPDVGPALDAIVRLRPKYMQIVGGEPLLVPGIAGHLKAIKEKVNPYILLITNMMVEERVLRDIAPCVDTLLVSIDGLGDINRRQRGVDGDVILDKMVRYARWLEEEGYPAPSLGTSTVVTRHSMEALPDFGRKMKERLPQVPLGIGIVSPYWHPLSFGYDFQMVSRLLGILEKIRNEGIRFYFADGDYPEAPRVLREEGIFPRVVNCKRQFFRANLLPDGRVTGCKPSYFNRCYVPRIERAVADGEYYDAGRLFYRAAEQFLFKKEGVTCLFPCKCTLWLEKLLNTTDDAAMPDAARQIAGKFTPEEIKGANTFLMRAYGMRLGKGLCEMLIRKD